MKIGQVKGLSSRRDQQILEKNRMIFFMSAMIVTALIVLALLGENPSGQMIQLIAGGGGYLALLIIHKKLKGTFWGMYDCLYVLLVVYILGLWSTDNTYVYALMFPVAMTVIFIMDASLGIRGIAAAVAVNIIYVIIHFVRCGMGDWKQTVSQLILAILTCVISAITILTLDRHNRENISDLQSTADVNIETTNRVVGASESISTQLDGAQNLVESLTKSINASNESMNEIAESIRHTAEAIQRQTAMTGEIQDNIESAGRRANNMQEASTNTMQVVEEGTHLLEELKIQSRETGEINEITRQATAELNERIKEVFHIVTTITSISDDTTLLSLNASIEAARAGEVGKGFAVVADEIRKLSEETRNSATQISEIITKLTEDITTATNNMELSATSAEKQHEMIEGVSEKFEVVYNSMEELTTDVDGITSEVNDIVSANTTIMDSISNLSATSQQVAAVSDSSIEVSNSSKEYMAEMNTVLEGIFGVSHDMKELVEVTEKNMEESLTHGREQELELFEKEINHINNPK